MMTCLKSCLMILLATLVVTSAVGAAEPYDLDKAHSFIAFKVRHMAVSSVRGQFNEYSAALLVDEGDLTKSSISLTIEAASIDTNQPQRDEHLRSGDFLLVESNPQITFVSQQITKLVDGKFQAAGDLTIRGVTRPVVLELDVAGPIKDPFGNHRIGIEGTVTIDRQDYGVNFSRVMDNGGLVVGDEVEITFGIEAARKLE